MTQAASTRQQHPLSGERGHTPRRRSTESRSIDLSIGLRNRLTLRRILWIDDELREDDASVLLLQLRGIEVDCAQSGVRGLSMACGGAYAGIILDLHLPDIDGISLLRLLASAKFACPVMVLTGYGDIQSSVTAMRFGATDFREKPVIGEDLILAVERLIKDSAPPASRFDAVAAEPESRQALACSLPNPTHWRVQFLSLVRAFRELQGLRSASEAPAGIETEVHVRPSIEHLERALGHLASDVASGELLVPDEFARQLRMSTKDMRRWLKQLFGVGYEQCRRALRLHPALQGTAFGDEQYAQIAVAAGYTHASQFTRDLRLLLGLSPKEFRRLCRTEHATRDRGCESRSVRS